jgi:hypothetical protein
LPKSKNIFNLVSFEAEHIVVANAVVRKNEELLPEQKDKNIQQAGFPDGHPL